jgi:hypothetical protein
MSKFNVGDQVLVNGAVVAEITTYDEQADRLVYVVSVGGGTDTVYGHISNTRLQRLVSVATGEDAEDEAPEPSADDTQEIPAVPADEFTTSESL